jgi:hypothetical protein
LYNLGWNKKENPLNHTIKGFLTRLVSHFVGMAGFEPAASTSQMWRDTGLRYIPLFPFGNAKIAFYHFAARLILKDFTQKPAGII